jgi:hypothetical protein
VVVQTSFNPRGPTMQGFWVKCDSSSQMNPVLKTLAYAMKTRAIKRNPQSQFRWQRWVRDRRCSLVAENVAFTDISLSQLITDIAQKNEINLFRGAILREMPRVSLQGDGYNLSRQGRTPGLQKAPGRGSNPPRPL